MFVISYHFVETVETNVTFKPIQLTINIFITPMNI